MVVQAFFECCFTHSQVRFDIVVAVVLVAVVVVAGVVVAVVVVAVVVVCSYCSGVDDIFCKTLSVERTGLGLGAIAWFSQGWLCG